MEIDKATTDTLNALTLDEKGLARGLVRSEQFDSGTNTVWLRAPSLKLGATITSLQRRSIEKGFNANFVNLYCDTLFVEDGTMISPQKERGKDTYSDLVLEIFARKLQFENLDKKPSFSYLLTEDSDLTIWTPNLPDDFQILFKLLQGQPIPYTPKIKPQNFGIGMHLSASGTDIERKQYDAPINAMEKINYLDLIDDNGNVVNKAYLNDDLPRLLQLQMLVAQAHTTSNKKLAIDLLYYVVAATNTKYSVYVYLQANTMLSNLLLGEGVLSVPSVNIYSAKMILKSRLVAAMAFEQAFRDFKRTSGGLKIQTITTVNALAKNQDAIQAYNFQKGLKEKEYSNAVKANQEAGKKLEDSRSRLDTLAQDFQNGLQKWQRKEKEQAAKDVFWQVLGAAAAIGAVVATGGLAAPLGALSIGALANGVSKVADVVRVLKKFYDQVKKLLEALEPVIKKIKELVNTVSTVIEALRTFNKATAASSTIRPNNQSTDPFNATAEYDRFDITVRELEESMKQYSGIEGKAEYFTALKIMVIDGKVAIATQANLVQRGNDLAIVLVQKEVEVRDEKRLSAAAETVETDQRVAEVLARAMFDRVLAIRSLVYLDFSAFITAYRYHTLSEDRVVTLSPVKPVVDYLDDIAALQGAIASYGSRELVQQRTFRLRTLAGYDTPRQLADAFSSGRTIQLSLSPYDAIWEGFERIRISRARCYLEGVKLNSSNEVDAVSVADGSLAPVVRLELRTSRQFFDRSWISSVPRTFIGESRTILFEYSPSTGAISCDGNYGQERDYTKHTPITTWLVRLLDDSAGEGDRIAPSNLDFTSFTGLRLEFLCDFVWKGNDA